MCRSGFASEYPSCCHIPHSVTFRVGSYAADISAYSPARVAQLLDFMSEPHWHALGIIDVMCLGCGNHPVPTESFDAMQLERERLSSEKQV